MHFRTLLAAFVFLAAIGPLLAQHRHPGDLVAEMYRLCNSVSIFADEGARKRFLSKRLQTALAEMDKRTPEGYAPDLDFDPVSNGQDPSVHDLRIRTESENAGQAVVIADFRSHENVERDVLRYMLVREDGAWKVDDIVSEGKVRWRVSDIIGAH